MSLDDELELLALGFARTYLPGGVLGTLAWQCVLCGAVVSKPALHRQWHEEQQA